MKKLSNIFLLVLAVMMFASCEGFLDIKPVGRVIPETAEDYRKLLNNAYASFPEDFNKTIFTADEYQLLENQNGLETYQNYFTWDYKGESNSYELNWRLYYKVIFECNNIIENKDNIKDGRKEEIEQLVGEAYALRGYAHFILANLFAPAYGKVNPATTRAVPVRLDTKTDVVPAQNTLEELYKQVVLDMEQAIDLMTVDTWMESDKYRLGKASTYGLLSRIYLYMEEWQKSIDMGEAALVLAHELTDLNVTAQVPNHYLQPESLWAMHLSIKSEDLPYVKLHYKLVDYFTVNPGDLREKTCFDDNGDVILVKKVGANELRVGMRVSEIYLNLAEAACKLDKISIAKDYLYPLLQVRYTQIAAQNKRLNIASMDQESLLSEIYLQRRVELAFEGQRWFDLRRTTQPAIIRSFNGEVYTLDNADARYTYPIPQEALDNNPNLQ